MTEHHTISCTIVLHANRFWEKQARHGELSSGVASRTYLRPGLVRLPSLSVPSSRLRWTRCACGGRGGGGFCSRRKGGRSSRCRQHSAPRTSKKSSPSVGSRFPLSSASSHRLLSSLILRSSATLALRSAWALSPPLATPLATPLAMAACRRRRRCSSSEIG